MYSNVFTGYFNGNGKKIVVGIRSNATNVGLFSELGNGGHINNLIIDSSVTGGLNSQNVGGLVGLMSGGYIENITNLAEVTGESPYSSVGGIAGRAEGYPVLSLCVNNGLVSGGLSIAGIVGTAFNDTPLSVFSLAIRDCRNAGTIQCLQGLPAEYSPTHMAGIVGYSYGSGNILLHGGINIGRILSSSSEYAGGIAAYFISVVDGQLHTHSNSGIVDGARLAVGGIVGWLSGVTLESSINTSWIEPLALYSGAIVGYNVGGVMRCYFDYQLCVLVGIGGGLTIGAVGLSTVDMLGNNLDPRNPLAIWVLDGGFVFDDNLYPRPFSNTTMNHPINLLSAAPIYLQNNERVDFVTTDFYVSNYESWGPPPFITQFIRPYWFQWGSFNDNFIPYLHLPHSVIGYINVPFPSPFPPTNTATINSTGGILMQDTLVVRLDYDWLYRTNYNGFYSNDYYIIFEKVVPVRVIRR